MTRAWLASVWMAIFFTVTSSGHAQSLGDLAKKAEEARAKKAEEERVKADKLVTTDKADNGDKAEKADKPDKAPAKVYTNKDLPTVGAASIPAAGDAGTPTVPSGNSADPKVVATPAVAEVKDEAWWRSHALVFRRTLADDITKLASSPSVLRRAARPSTRAYRHASRDRSDERYKLNDYRLKPIDSWRD